LEIARGGMTAASSFGIGRAPAIGGAIVDTAP
jgi:hypothetical protein